MGRHIDLVGKNFERLLVVSKRSERSGSGCVLWDCLCSCGGKCVRSTAALNSGTSRSCGCLFLESVSRNGKKKKTHGMEGTKTYACWSSMKSRCLNKNDGKYPLYGGRGISVCERWVNSFENFLEDMGEKPSEMTLDRINTDGNYEPRNCRWASHLDQQNNRRDNILINYEGTLKTVSQWARIINIAPDTIYARIKSGWPASRLLAPVRGAVTHANK